MLSAVWGINEYTRTVVASGQITWRVYGPFFNPNLLAGYLLLALPVAAWGLLNAAAPYALTGLAAVRFSSDRYHYETAKVLFGMLFFGMFWGAQTALAVHFAGVAWAVAYALLLPPSAATALYVRRERERIWDNIRVFFLFLRHGELRELLEKERRHLEKELADLGRLMTRSGSLA